MVSRALLAGLITVIVFISGFSVGMLWDSFRKDKVSSELDEISVYSTSLFLESQLIENISCSSYLPLLSGAMKDLDESLENYNFYSETSLFGIDRQKLLYRRYLLSNIRYWTLLKESQNRCDWNVSTVLFFFDRECEGDCNAMSTRLSYLKAKYEEDLLVFPINLELAGEDPVAQTLLAVYDSETLPTLVVNGETYGEMETAELESLICQNINCSG